MSQRLDWINRSLHLDEDDLAQSIDPEYLAFKSLASLIQYLVQELGKVKREIMTGARLIGTVLEQIDTSIVQVEAATKGLEEAIKKVSGRMDG